MQVIPINRIFHPPFSMMMTYKRVRVGKLFRAGEEWARSYRYKPPIVGEKKWDRLYNILYVGGFVFNAIRHSYVGV